ncbi:hypothetical protein MAPG_10271 [Magnaporthiopsis poae ATCC 64411]|uniref:Heterokaryon incompatibility domain-containing protein n=1 Tax=Magnaporthiopsis poae (strain ATCC 64411 / 73-15) TaxID=644358 RepID=A0A0C4EC57_MAGP6|nr:hypothetical protein MAPG_10271 [Magnaporthiopsis poae ATCC 64411]
MPPFNHYQYQALCVEDAIRLVVLDAATDNEAPLSCSLIQRPRSARHIEYFAISYAWGVPEFTRTLEIRHDDGDDTSYLRITSNVEALLRHFRTPDNPCYLWIDAICLNQDDETEKAQQIPMMGRIYEEAKGVQIWVGPSVPATPKLFAFFRKSSRIRRAEQSQMARRIVFFMTKYFHGPGPGLHVIIDFFQRPWFSRRWIIQEACLARQATVHCGNCSIPLPVLALAARQFQNLDLSDYPIRMAANLGRPSAGLSVLELLWNFHEAACLEPRDRIGALLGLVGEESRFPVDCAAPWTDLYKQAASFILRTGGNDVRLQVLLHLFEFGPLAASPGGSYPSWVPDWTKTRRRDLPYHSRIRNVDTFEPYPSSPGYPALASLGFHHETFQIYGDALIATPQVCKVTFAKSLLQPPKDEEQRAEQAIAVLRELLTKVPDAITHIFTLSSLIKAVTGFRYPKAERERLALKTPSLDNYLDEIGQRLPNGRASRMLDSLRNLPSVLQHGSLLVLNPLGPEPEACRGYGIGPKGTRVGDMMIPLWYPDWDSDASFIFPGESVTAINAVTMLAVKPTGEKCFQHGVVSLDEEARHGFSVIRSHPPFHYVLATAPDDKALERDIEGVSRRCERLLGRHFFLEDEPDFLPSRRRARFPRSRLIWAECVPNMFISKPRAEIARVRLG